MKHIISNPHNGASVDHEGIKIDPGYELEVPEREANMLRARFGFLLHRIEDGIPSKKPKVKKLKGELTFHTHNAGTAVEPLPDEVRHETESK